METKEERNSENFKCMYKIITMNVAIDTWSHPESNR